MGGKVGEGKGGAGSLVQVVEFEGLEIADEDVAGPVAFGQGVEVFARLAVGAREVAARALLLDDEDARPEEVDVAAGVVEAPHVLLVARDGAPPDAEDLEEVVIKTLRLAFFIGRARPGAGEARRAHTHLVPGEAHV